MSPKSTYHLLDVLSSHNRSIDLTHIGSNNAKTMHPTFENSHLMHYLIKSHILSSFRNLEKEFIRKNMTSEVKAYLKPTYLIQQPLSEWTPYFILQLWKSKMPCTLNQFTKEKCLWKVREKIYNKNNNNESSIQSSNLSIFVISRQGP